MARLILEDAQWSEIEPLLTGREGARGAKAHDNRKFLEGVLWIARTGAPWRDLPTELGNWHTTYMRFNRWCRTGRWHAIWQKLSAPKDTCAIMIDSTIVRAHQHAAGARKNAGPQALGRSRGGLSTKIHACCDALGQILRCFISGGQEADINHAQALIEGIKTQALLADKGYDANVLLEKLAANDIEAVIPPKKNRVEQREYDRQVYKHRNLVERMFNRFKDFRRIATRYEKLARSFLGNALRDVLVQWSRWINCEHALVRQPRNIET